MRTLSGYAALATGTVIRETKSDGNRRWTERLRRRCGVIAARVVGRYPLRVRGNKSWLQPRMEIRDDPVT